ncbi:hypothetical protein [Nonomuraea aridisoli]|uniref:Uncharacterized protein n=1 Tax=Nonomuraea aridisoli TaxID=2070368 RepID=A0A2W2E112_9ACTN|nr:hypothetical protein [Nonomuraea aridisoli]PZG05788.1 hypothetical protein C1J01_43070 [Nonomuraea aridisoli]
MVSRGPGVTFSHTLGRFPSLTPGRFVGGFASPAFDAVSRFTRPIVRLADSGVAGLTVRYLISRFAWPIVRLAGGGFAGVGLCRRLGYFAIARMAGGFAGISAPGTSVRFGVAFGHRRNRIVVPRRREGVACPGCGDLGGLLRRLDVSGGVPDLLDRAGCVVVRDCLGGACLPRLGGGVAVCCRGEACFCFRVTVATGARRGSGLVVRVLIRGPGLCGRGLRVGLGGQGSRRVLLRARLGRE